MQFSSYALDMIATDLSKFTNAEVPELILRDDTTLHDNVLESVVGVFGGQANAYPRFLVTNFVRRIYASVETYKLGRLSAIEYVNDDRRHRIAPYFMALTHFECCISYSWQVADLMMQLANSESRLFDSGDRSILERLHGIYTFGTKHSHNRFDAAVRPEMPTTVWLTNGGIACCSKGMTLKFSELHSIISRHNDFFYKIQAEAYARYRVAQPSQK